MKNLKDILYGVAIQQVKGTTDVAINALVFDSRQIRFNDVFIAIRGSLVDGHEYIDKAIDLGAKVIICETYPQRYVEGVSYIQVANSNSALAIMASNYYDNPSSKFPLVGVTGTNGKTTVATLLYELFTKAGYKAGLLSTVKILVGTTEYKATHTTPDSVTINFYLDKMLEEGVDYCFMEVSSHGIHQKRSEGLTFAGGIFTNLSHDHLDYHKTFAEYRNVKKAFFDGLHKNAFALTNIDDKNGNYMLQNTRAKKYSYALKTLADYKAKILEKQFSGTLIQIDGTEVWTKLIGQFNIYNLLAISATAELLGLDKMEILTVLSELESVSGRFQYTVSEDQVIGIVDYAHTPDALKNVLETINDIRSGNETLLTVVGCGGNRDKTKRPKMAQIAAELSNQCIFTSDNPRDEDPQQIIDDMEAGVSPENYKKTLSVVDRKQAIKTACTLSKPGDIILVAGKGHENYQEIKGQRSHFDDMEELQNCFNQLKNKN